MFRIQFHLVIFKAFSHLDHGTSVRKASRILRSMSESAQIRFPVVALELGNKILAVPCGGVQGETHVHRNKHAVWASRQNTIFFQNTTNVLCFYVSDSFRRLTVVTSFKCFRRYPSALWIRDQVSRLQLSMCAT